MRLPELTHLQFLILSILLNGDRSGRVVRDALETEGAKKSPAAFYQLMARMEEAGHVEGWYEQSVIDEVPVKQRWYKITGHGITAWENTRAFYTNPGVPIFINPGLQGA